MKDPIEMKEWSNFKKSNSFRFRRVYSIKLTSNQMDKIHLKKKVVQKKIHKGPFSRFFAMIVRNVDHDNFKKVQQICP